eukprot:3781157-Ditylum_brightwellii.AAC.1
MKTSPKVRRQILAKQDTIGVLVANKHFKKLTIMYSPKIEAIVDVENDSVKEVLVATASDSCAKIQPIKTSISDPVSDFTEVVKLTSPQQKNFIIGRKLKEDDIVDSNVSEDAGSTYIIRLPVSIPLLPSMASNW